MSELSTEAPAAPAPSGPPASAPTEAPSAPAPGGEGGAPEADYDDGAPADLEVNASEEGEEVIDGDGQDADEALENAVAEMMEIEWEDGNKYQIPAALKDAFLANQAFTQKTQKLAEDERAIMGGLRERFETLQARERHITDLARVQMIDARLSQYDGDPENGQPPVNWVAWAQQNPAEMAQHKAIYDQMKAERDKVQRQIDEHVEKARNESDRAQQVAVIKAQEVISEKIPGWGTELAQAMTKHAVEDLKIPMDMVNQMNAYPWAIQMLHAHYMQNKALDGARPGNEPKTPPKPTRKSKGSAPVSDPNKMDMKSWVEWRNKQVYGKR